MPADIPTTPPLRTTCSDGFLLGLESLMRRTGQGRHLAATVLECEGSPDIARIRHAAESLGRNHPILRAKNARSKKDWIARWQTDGEAPLSLALSEKDRPAGGASCMG